MMPTLVEPAPEIEAVSGDSRQGMKASRRLAGHIQGSHSIRLRLMDSDTEEEDIEVPAAAARLLAEILLEMENGNTVAVTVSKAELTTQEAAEMLCVSRPYLIGLLDTGKIPSRKVGTHRRVLREDVAEYKTRIDKARLATLQELAAQAQEFDMGY